MNHRLEFLASSADRHDDCSPTTLESSELLTRAKAAVDKAREQIQRTKTLLMAFKENREPNRR